MSLICAQTQMQPPKTPRYSVVKPRPSYPPAEPSQEDESMKNVCKRYSCQQCDKSYSSKDDLSRHMIVAHHGERKFKCEICKP